MQNLLRKLTSKNVGTGLIAYAVISFVLANVGILTNLQANWQTQLMLVAAAGGVLIYWSKNPDKAWFKLPGDGMPPAPPVVKTTAVKSSYQVGISDDEFKDLAAVDHLTDRFVQVNDPEGIKLCKDVQNKLFDIHHKTEATAVVAEKVV